MSAKRKCKCRHCHQVIEFASHGEGRTIGCPHCGKETTLRSGPAPADEGPAYIKKTLEPSRSGCAVLLLGGLLLFWFPYGTIMAIGLFIWGLRLSKRVVCSRCGNTIQNPQEKTCPFCKTEFSEKQNQPGANAQAG